MLSAWLNRLAHREARLLAARQAAREAQQLLAAQAATVSALRDALEAQQREIAALRADRQQGE